MKYSKISLIILLICSTEMNSMKKLGFLSKEKAWTKKYMASILHHKPDEVFRRYAQGKMNEKEEDKFFELAEKAYERKKKYLCCLAETSIRCY